MFPVGDSSGSSWRSVCVCLSVCVCVSSAIFLATCCVLLKARWDHQIKPAMLLERKGERFSAHSERSGAPNWIFGSWLKEVVVHSNWHKCVITYLGENWQQRIKKLKKKKHWRWKIENSSKRHYCCVVAQNLLEKQNKHSLHLDLLCIIIIYTILYILYYILHIICSMFLLCSNI